jgi:hypothetical protein
MVKIALTVSHKEPLGKRIVLFHVRAAGSRKTPVPLSASQLPSSPWSLVVLFLSRFRRALKKKRQLCANSN